MSISIAENDLHEIISVFLPTTSPIYPVLYYGLIVLAGSAVLRFLWVMLARLFGLYHVDQYFYWPRLPWRILWRAWMVLHDWWQEIRIFGKRSSAGFAGPLTVLSLLYRCGKIPLGRAYVFGLGLLMPIGVKTKRHLMIIGMTGSGKTVFLTLLVGLWQSSVFLVDPKGTITRTLMGQSRKEWHVLAPYDRTIATASWNFFDEIKAAEERFGEDAAVRIVEKISEALIVTEPGEHNPFFPDSSRALVSAVILHVRTVCPDDQHNPVHVYQLITRGYWTKNRDAQIAFDLLIEDMLKNPAYDGLIASRASAIADAGKTTRGNVLATLREKIKWLGLPELASILNTSTFLCQDLKEKDDIVVSLAAPAGDIRGHLAPFSRLLTNMLCFSFESIPGNKKTPCLFAVDELPAQGHNEYLEQVAPLLRSNGVQLIGAAQDLDLLAQAYPKSWGGFLGNADAVFWMASNNQSTLTYLSQLLGKKSLVQKVKGNRRRDEKERDVMTPDQLRHFLSADNEKLIVTRAGARPLKLKLLKYYADLPVLDYSPDPDHKEALLKRMTRRLLGPTPGAVEAAPRQPARSARQLTSD